MAFLGGKTAERRSLKSLRIAKKHNKIQLGQTGCRLGMRKTHWNQLLVQTIFAQEEGTWLKTSVSQSAEQVSSSAEKKPFVQINK